MEKTILNVDGMSCDHCVKTIKKAVGDLSGVSEVEVDLDKKTVTVTHDPSLSPIDRIKAEIVDVGYDIVA
jgi:copper chaperone